MVGCGSSTPATAWLFKVDCALQRIRDGTYGFREETGHVIPPERHRAIP